MIQVIWVRLLANGQAMKINDSDFDWNLHAPLGPNGEDLDEKPVVEIAPETVKIETGTADELLKAAQAKAEVDAKALDTTPGTISTVNQPEALELVKQATTLEQLATLEADEKANGRHPGGRLGVMATIAQRRKELVG